MEHIASEGAFPFRHLKAEHGGETAGCADLELTATDNVLILTTEIYKRDDGAGRPVWEMRRRQRAHERFHEIETQGNVIVL